MMLDAIGQQNQTAQTISSGGYGFINLTLVFGDFIKGMGILLNAITFQYLVNILQIFRFNDIFVIGVRAICAITSLAAILYMLTGRGTKMSI